MPQAYAPTVAEHPDFWGFVEANINVSPASLRLAMHSRGAEEWQSAAILQIECRQRFGKKLADTLERFPRFFFPTALSGEQCTSDSLAAFHATLVGAADSVVDLTSGLGIDAMHLARRVQSVVAVELNPCLASALKYNADGLGISNISVLCADCREVLPDLGGTVAFVDPARRSADGGRVFSLADCQPDVQDMLLGLAANFKRIIVKMSPMLDVSHTLRQLPGTSAIYAIGTATECKELVADVCLNNVDVADVEMHSVTIRPGNETTDYVFDAQAETSAPQPRISGNISVGQYIYEPYPATMKVAPHKLLAEQFGLTKPDVNTHLYVGSTEDTARTFPGRCYRVVEVVAWQSKFIKRFRSRYPRIDVTARNFGMTAAALAAKLGVAPGPSTTAPRLFAIGTAGTGKLLLVADPVR